MTEPENVHKLLEDYAVKGDVQAKRVEGFWENKRVKHPAKTRKKEKEQAADMDAVWSWAAAACIGLYMGLMVNGWYMTVHLSKILHQSALVWVGLIGIAVLTAVFIAFAEKLVSENVTVALYQIPWAGLCLFINLVLSYFIGNKITALISAIILVAVYTGMRIKKYL